MNGAKAVPSTSRALAAPSVALLVACRRTLTSTGTSILGLEAKDVSNVIIPDKLLVGKSSSVATMS